MRRTPSHLRRSGPLGGLTLIELLVVLTILVLLVSSAIPVVSPTSDERRLREASRGLNTFIAGAQARAVQSGRSFGVMLKKLSEETADPDDNAVCLEVLYVEEPRPYAGFDENARVFVGTDSNGPFANRQQYRIRFVRTENLVRGDLLPASLDPDPFPPGLFRRGDQIRVGGVLFEFTDTTDDVDNQGFYLPTAGNPDGTLFARPLETLGPALKTAYDNEGDRLTDPQPEATRNRPAPYWTEPLAYEVIRQPTPTSAPPYQLPEGTAIDLRASGVGDLFFYADDRADTSSSTGYADVTSNPSPVMILFSPEGTVSELIVNRGQPPNDGLDGPDDNNNDNDDRFFAEPVSGDLHLLIGQRENIPAAVADVVDFATFTGTHDELEEAKAEVNWLSGQGRWVTIGSRTGAVTTVEAGFVDPVDVINTLGGPTTSVLARRRVEILRSRQLATTKSPLGGK